MTVPEQMYARTVIHHQPVQRPDLGGEEVGRHEEVSSVVYHNFAPTTGDLRSCLQPDRAPSTLLSIQVADRKTVS